MRKPFLALLALPLSLLMWPPKASGADAVVRSVTATVSGPGWTHPRVLQRGVSLAAGAPFDPEVLWEDVARLRNTELFQDVTATVRHTTEGVDLWLDAVDRFSLIPVFEPAFGGDVLQVIAGLRDANFLGLAQDLTVYGGLFARDQVRGPILGGQWIHRQVAGRHSVAVVAEMSQSDALFFDASGVVVERYDIRSGTTLLQGILKPRRGLEPGAYIGWSGRWAEAIIPVTGGMPSMPPLRQDMLLGATLRLGAVDYDAFLYEGRDLVFDLSQRVRLRGGAGYPAATLQGRLFSLPVPWLNLAVRGRLSGRLNPLSADDLAWGGFGEIRGLVSGRLRGRYGALLNAEARATVFRRLWNTFFVQSALFCDAGVVGRSLRPPRNVQTGTSCGLGLRGSIHQLAGVFGRLDLAFAFENGGIQPGIHFGVRQFF